MLAAALAAVAFSVPWAQEAGDPPGYEKGRPVREIEAARERVRDESMARMRDRDAAEARTRAELRLSEDPAGCVAYDPVVGECVVTVEAFNHRAEGWSPGTGRARFPDDVTSADPPAADSIRRNILAEMLAAEFPRVQALRLGLGDSVSRRLREAQGGRLARLGNSFGDSALRALYRAHGDRFRARRERVYLALASSDSAFLDSIRRSGETRALLGGAAKDAGKTTGKAAGKSERLRGTERPLYRWQTLSEAELPSEVAVAALALKTGEATAPLRVPYGFLLLAGAGSRDLRAVPYTEALPALLAIAADPAAGTSGEEALLDYFRSHRDRFSSPDTAVLRVWLVPARAVGQSGRRPESLPEGARAPRSNWEDTLSVRPSIADESGLPPDVRRAMGFSRAFIGQRSGPLRSASGTWYFRVLDVRPGGRPLEYAEARSAVMRLLFQGAGDTASLGSVWVAQKRGDWEKQQASEVLEELFRPDPEAVEKIVRSGEADSLAGELPPGLSVAEKAEQVGLAVRARETSRSRERRFQSWMRQDLQLAFIDFAE